MRSTLAGVLHDVARSLLELSHQAHDPQLQRAAQQLNLVGEALIVGSKDLEEAQAWLDAGRLTVAEHHARAGGARVRGSE